MISASSFEWLLAYGPPLLFGMVLAAVPAAGADNLESLKAAADRVARIGFDNGMIGLIHEDHSAPVVAVQIWVGTGSIHENEYLGGGLSHYVEHMIFKGTTNRGVGVIASEISDAGGRLNAYTAYERTVFHTVLPSASWRKGVDVLFDAVMNATFPEGEYAREKEVVLREMAMGEDNPDTVLHHLLFRTAYAVHPFRYPIIGHADIFRRLTRDDLLVFFRRNYVPDNTLVVVAGDVKRAEVEARLRAIARDFTRRPRAPIVPPAEPPQISPRVARLAGKYEITRLHVVYHTVPLTDPDAPALDLLAAIVGQGRSSRLVDDIKEQRRLAHSIDAWSFTSSAPGLFGVSATCDPANEDKLLAAIEEQVQSWVAGRVTKAELAKARRQFLVAQLGGLETMDGLAGKFAWGEFFARDPKFSITYLERLAALTPRDLQAAAARYFKPENRTLAVLCPAGQPGAEPSPAAVDAAPVQRRILPGGIILLMREDHRVPMVNCCAVFNGGVLHETEDKNGITQLMVELLKGGTTTRDARRIAREIESLGAALSTFAGNNSFGLQGRCLKDDFGKLLEIMTDCLADPAFPSDEVEKARSVQLAGIAEQREQPMFIAQQALFAKLYPGHPYRMNAMGNEDAVKRLSASDLREHHRRLVARGNMVVAVFGDIDVEACASAVTGAFGQLRKDDAPARECPPPKPALPAESVLREPRQQAIVLIGYPGIDLRDPRRDALTVLESAMRGMSSTIYREVREKRGLAYYTGAALRPGLGAGHFMLLAGTREDAVPEVRRLLGEEARRVAEEGLTAEEFERARTMIAAAKAMDLQDNHGLALGCALNELYGLGYDHDLKIAERLAALTPAQVREAAGSVLRPGSMAVSIVLPSSR